MLIMDNLYDDLILINYRSMVFYLLLCFSKPIGTKLNCSQGQKNRFFSADFSTKIRFSVGLETILGRKNQRKIADFSDKN